MEWNPAGIRAWMSAGPNRIALSTATRGVLSCAIPLLALPLIGLVGDTGVVVIGALGVSMTDVGGFYVGRLLAMLVMTLAGPLLVLAGVATQPWWELSALVMFLTALLGCMGRVFGPLGGPMGVNAATAFLVGIEAAPAFPDHFAPRLALDYLAGGGWTILVTLAMWQLRPYKRLELELASEWQAAAALVGGALAEAESDSVVGRRRLEQLVAERQRAASESIERARSSLGAMRGGTTSAGIVMAQLYMLLRAGSRIGASALTLTETHAECLPPAIRHQAAATLENACREVARILAEGKGELDIAEFRAQVTGMNRYAAGAAEGADGSAQAESTSALAFIQALRHLDNAAEALRLMFAHRHGVIELLRGAFGGIAGGGMSGFTELRARIGAHLTFRSIILRHALRTAVVAAASIALSLVLALPHGIWLPLTAIAILQPEYGGTLVRAVQRTGGTLGGAVIAALLLVGLRDSAAFDAAMVPMLFATFFLLRRNYGWAVTFLTPLVILLLKLTGPNPWIDLQNRVIYTLCGAALAVIGGFHLWPEWERERLPSRVARAVKADRKLVTAVIDALAVPSAAESPDFGALRRDAEMAIANANAAFQNMLSEPTAYRARLSAAFQAMVNVERLYRHALALTVHIGRAPAARPELAEIGFMLGQALDATAAAFEANTRGPERPDWDAVLAKLSLATRPQDSSLSLLVSRMVSDCSALIAAANSRQNAAAMTDGA